MTPSSVDFCRKTRTVPLNISCPSRTCAPLPLPCGCASHQPHIQDTQCNQHHHPPFLRWRQSCNCCMRPSVFGRILQASTGKRVSSTPRWHAIESHTRSSIQQVRKPMASSSAIPCSVHSAVCDRVHGLQSSRCANNGIVASKNWVKNANTVPVDHRLRLQRPRGTRAICFHRSTQRLCWRAIL
jgi:hypothetical protein